jgi:uncharacterized membrane protein YbhN (UPF0104 family)
MTEPIRAAKQPLYKNAALRRMVQIGVTLGAFWYLFSIVDTRELAQALTRVSPSAWCLAVAITSLALACGVLRWWLLFHAFGAERIPSLALLGKYYSFGLFYNTYLPGGISGDVVRGLASQHAWPAGSAGSFASVLVERALGLTALLGLTAIATVVHLLAFLAVLTTTLVLAHLNRLAAFVPSALRGLLQRLPAPRAWSPLWAALLLSLVTQLAPALCGYILLHSLFPSATILDALVIVPLASAAAFLPITVSGAGVRETLFVTLYGLIHVPGRDALAACVALWLAQAALAALGGVYMLVARDPWRKLEHRSASGS